MLLMRCYFGDQVNNRPNLFSALSNNEYNLCVRYVSPIDRDTCVSLLFLIINRFERCVVCR